MIDITFAQLQAWLSLFLWPFMRISAFVMVAPLLGHSSLPSHVKISLAAILTLVISATLPAMPEIPLVSWASLGIMVQQMVIGMGMALAMMIAFAVVQVAGEFIGLQMGLAFASFFSADSNANTMILSRWFYLIALLLFMALDGHLMMIRILAESFTLLPIANAGFNAAGFEQLTRFASLFFNLGLLLALPLVSVLLIINLTLGILNRAAPQFTVFSVGFPVSLTLGLILLTVLMTDFSGFLESVFMEGMEMMVNFVVAIAG